MDALNYISVAESARRELTAKGARIAVSIAGQSFFTGREAFKKAAEVSECVTSLSACGIAEEKIQIKNVSTQVGSGFLTKSSSAVYDLEVLCDSMELLAAAVASIASLKNSEIVSLAWNYSDVDKIKREILAEAVQSANASADVIVGALDTSLAGVHRLQYEVSGLDNQLYQRSAALSQGGRSKFSAASMSSVSEGLNLSHTATVVVSVVAEFLVETKGRE